MDFSFPSPSVREQVLLTNISEKAPLVVELLAVARGCWWAWVAAWPLVLDARGALNSDPPKRTEKTPLAHSGTAWQGNTARDLVLQTCKYTITQSSEMSKSASAEQRHSGGSTEEGNQEKQSKTTTLTSGT